MPAPMPGCGVWTAVFQNPKTQFYCINSTDELAFQLENRNIDKDLILDKIQYYSAVLGTKELLDLFLSDEGHQPRPFPQTKLGETQ